MRDPLGDVVAALQTLAKQLHVRAGNAAVKGNPWQHVDRLRRQWVGDVGPDLLAGLPAATVRTLRLGFAQRHVLEHNGGIVDEQYQRETGEGTLGRRLQIRARFVEQFFAAATVLADRLAVTAQQRAKDRHQRTAPPRRS